MRALFCYLSKESRAACLQGFFMKRTGKIFTRTMILLALLLAGQGLWATHNRAGEITYVQIGPLTIRMTITTYTKTSSVGADRDSLRIFWGDGTSEMVARSNGNGQPLPNNIKRNLYTAEHTYPGRGTYTLSMFDPNRIGDILNVNPPNSISVPFFLQTSLTLLNPQFQGVNSSAVLLQPPIDFACVGQTFIHNPNAYDPEGDSLSYELVVPLQDENMEVPRYSFPSQISPGPNNRISLDPVTGDFVWNSPQQAGEYNIAIRINEYRNGVLINYIIRDMQILVLDNCSNRPPALRVVEELCVVAGDTVNLLVTATDPDLPTQRIRLSALGGPLVLADSPAEFRVDTGFRDQPAIGQLYWETSCAHVSPQFYTVVFKAQDSWMRQGVTGDGGLTDLRTLRIKVVGPPPEGLEAEAEADRITLSWDKPYLCDPELGMRFQGFSVWRRNGSRLIVPDTCDPGLEGKGYEVVSYNTSEMMDGRYVFTDVDVERGKTYCYRVQGEFAQLSAAGNPYNRVGGLPSVEVCLQLSRDVPLIIENTVLRTDMADGSIRVSWVNPLPRDLDTLAHPGPYLYRVERADGIDGTNFAPVPRAEIRADFFGSIADSSYTDAGLNTVVSGYNYRLAFYTGGDELVPYGYSEPASSIFLKTSPRDEAVTLDWDVNVSWENFEYTIFRRDPGAVDFDSLTTVFRPPYTDSGLINGENYCYLVRSTGSYGLAGLPEPLINFSQEKCVRPVDIDPPCAPELELSNDCDSDELIGEEDIFNRLSWSNPFFSCPELADDLAGFRVYYAPPGADYELIAELSIHESRVYNHRGELGISGCYRVTALDTAGNESVMSEERCAENCPLYQLPNVFTPNGDGSNDTFRPFPYRFVESIDLQVFNRWGGLVFETSDPDINWDGRDSGGNILADGVYYYHCRVYVQRSDGSRGIYDQLKGFIEILKGN